MWPASVRYGQPCVDGNDESAPGRLSPPSHDAYYEYDRCLMRCGNNKGVQAPCARLTWTSPRPPLLRSTDTNLAIIQQLPSLFSSDLANT